MRVDLVRQGWAAPVAGTLRAEILVSRQQLNALGRKSPKRVAVSKVDRLVFVTLYCLAPKVLDALKMLQPETVVRWHRADFRAYWRWRSQLILEMPVAKSLWGARGAMPNCRRSGSMSLRPRS